jgi:hypothetical protein
MERRATKIERASQGFSVFSGFGWMALAIAAKREAA